ncbi:MAG: hypothetical protein Q8Q35_03255 [Nanoarchaeota archaeon]|nr:hypothetical protein [Nanoarchaeota archaeon]
MSYNYLEILKVLEENVSPRLGLDVYSIDSSILDHIDEETRLNTGYEPARFDYSTKKSGNLRMRPSFDLARGSNGELISVYQNRGLREVIGDESIPDVEIIVGKA